jgi:hypothetical protein
MPATGAGKAVSAALTAVLLAIFSVGCEVRSPSGAGATILRTSPFLVVPSAAGHAEVPGSDVTGGELAAVASAPAARLARSAAASAAPAARRQVPAFQTRVPGEGFLAAYLRAGSAVMRARPNGRVVAHLAARTQFGSLRVIAVIARARHGRWLKVIGPELPNNYAAWIDAKQVWLYRVPWSLDADISQRRITVRHYGRVVGSFPVAVGRPGSETPRGLFSVTDKLLLSVASPYGCCVLALSGHQPNVPQGWGGGDRLGIHATDDPSSIGYAASLGCLRAPEAVMRKLVYRVPLGARVRIHD